MKLREYAERAGISVQRAGVLARQGRIPAHREGREWVVDDDAPLSVRRSRRPLSSRSQQQLIEFFDTQNLDHVVGTDRVRTAERIRLLRQVEYPGALLRDYFAGSPEPRGFGGASMVRAALHNKDEFVAEVVRYLPRENLPDMAAVARCIRDHRLIRGLNLEEAASLSEMSPHELRAIEDGETPRRGTLTVLKVLRALDAPTPSLVRTQTERSAA